VHGPASANRSMRQQPLQIGTMEIDDRGFRLPSYRRRTWDAQLREAHIGLHQVPIRALAVKNACFERMQIGGEQAFGHRWILPTISRAAGSSWASEAPIPR